MSEYTLSKTVTQPYEPTVEAVKAGLADQGFGVLTEIDLAATLHAKLGVTIPPQVILGACRPQLAYEAIQADPSIAAVLPCNVVVRTIDETTTVVEAFDPDAMVNLSPNAGKDDALATIAADARQRLAALLDNLA
ncbi:DUF302 domain-containing protein [Nocardioides sp.]|uniref:DUF302 domain-containing protein n=1 Tax=Nocardioides sp. TaxID=35761 RepID=UPI002D158648|nr:DUF302 domain-containing protein [Nocardioides sp.]HXH78750.1 DUF302 domain-containing protein [Nocardioides sp.]